jgi:hypothetical protein
MRILVVWVWDAIQWWRKRQVRRAHGQANEVKIQVFIAGRRRR